MAQAVAKAGDVPAKALQRAGFADSPESADELVKQASSEPPVDAKSLAQELAKAMKEVIETRKTETEDPKKASDLIRLLKLAEKVGLISAEGMCNPESSESEAPAPETLLPPSSPSAIKLASEEAHPSRPIPWTRLLIVLLILGYFSVAILGAVGWVDVGWRNSPPGGVRFIDPHNGKVVDNVPLNSAGGNTTSSSGFLSNVLWPLPLGWRGVNSLLSGLNRQKPEPTLVVFPMVDTLTAEQCILARPEDLKIDASGRLMGGSINHHELRTSLLYHIGRKHLSGMCAQHVGVPVCYCVLDMRHKMRNQTVVQAPEDQEYLELFNPRIIGVSRNKIRQVHERNIFCSKQYFAKRFEAITVEYLDGVGNLWERDFNGTHSFNLQHAAEIHRGMRTCMDNSADLLMLLLRGRLGGGPENDPFERQMLFTNTETHRTERPSVPKALPAPPVPVIPDPVGEPKK